MSALTAGINLDKAQTDAVLDSTSMTVHHYILLHALIGFILLCIFRQFPPLTYYRTLFLLKGSGEEYSEDRTEVRYVYLTSELGEDERSKRVELGTPEVDEQRESGRDLFTRIRKCLVFIANTAFLVPQILYKHRIEVLLIFFSFHFSITGPVITSLDSIYSTVLFLVAWGFLLVVILTDVVKTHRHLFTDSVSTPRILNVHFTYFAIISTATVLTIAIEFYQAGTSQFQIHTEALEAFRKAGQTRMFGRAPLLPPLLSLAWVRICHELLRPLLLFILYLFTVYVLKSGYLQGIAATAEYIAAHLYYIVALVWFALSSEPRVWVLLRGSRNLAAIVKYPGLLVDVFAHCTNAKCSLQAIVMYSQISWPGASLFSYMYSLSVCLALAKLYLTTWEDLVGNEEGDVVDGIVPYNYTRVRLVY